nr:hypothetical protein [Mycolicibacterium malmesburyense]CRL76282.1 hypothetical protein CPGR_03913 [Mycolicibacterium malmesburyense]
MTTHTNTTPVIHWLVGAAAVASFGAVLLTGSATAFADDGSPNIQQQQPSSGVVVAPPTVVERELSSNVNKKYDETANGIVRNIRG